jgi:hypothetical protein
MTGHGVYEYVWDVKDQSVKNDYEMTQWFKVSSEIRPVLSFSKIPTTYLNNSDAL